MGHVDSTGQNMQKVSAEALSGYIKGSCTDPWKHSFRATAKDSSCWQNEMRLRVRTGLTRTPADSSPP